MIFRVDSERQAAASHPGGDGGYAMAALLVAIAVMSVMMSMALPTWRHAAQREKEAELVFRGEQYARAVALYQRKFAGAFPPSIDVLLDQRFLRKAYKDPMVEDGEFEILYQTSAIGAPGSPQEGATNNRGGGGTAPTPPRQSSGTLGSGTIAGARGGIVGVVSRSKESSIREYNGRDKYNEWQFVYTNITNQPGGAPGAATPGQAVPPGGLRPGMASPGAPGGRGQPGPGGGFGGAFPGASAPRR